MDTVYQRFSGKINTNSSFPAPPEGGKLLGGGRATEEGNTNAGNTARPSQDPPRNRVVHHSRSQADDEDVRQTISLPVQYTLCYDICGTIGLKY